MNRPAVDTSYQVGCVAVIAAVDAVAFNAVIGNYGVENNGVDL